MQLLCNILHRRHSVLEFMIRIKIKIQYRFKLPDKIIINCFIGDKLPFVKAAAVIKQKFNL